ncbi:hypothetical protein Fmac_021173 [Flemingia macrophylla]|uniref:TMV resistance protein N n=1 Tax=Flemingia macrophylla TaxID=520843 RepID=A0ABD1LW31_9FABA
MSETKFQIIEDIVQAIIKILGHKFSGFVDDLIGIQPRVQALESSLKLSSENDDVSVLGVVGMGGIGKTTHVLVLYDRISPMFNACCFIENVSKIYKDGGHTAVQKQILHQTLKEQNLETYSPSEISGIMRHRLPNIKVLVVLDNVDQIEQLQELGIKPELLFKGSRIIVTTRDEHILKVYGKYEMYRVSLLNENEASELFHRKAFKSEDQISSCMELIPEVLKYVQRLPLALKVMGSFLCTRDAIQWRDVLDKLKTNPNDKIMNVLQMSVDGLDYEEQEIFLHIACFFKGERKNYVYRILECCGLHPHIGIPRIIEKSLITIRDEEIHMHDMIQELGKKIVRNQFPEEPGLWSRLWLYEDFYQVSMTGTGTDNVKTIVLDKKEDISKCRVDGLSEMKDLRLLILYHQNFSESLKSISHKLRYLLWDGYPFDSLPLNFMGVNIVELNMPNSNIKCVWEGVKNFPCLKRMDLSNSKYLAETPDFSEIPKLERLDLSGCTNLLHVHPSIGLLEKLVFLSLRNCSNLVNINFVNRSNQSSLTVLNFSGCIKLRNTPDFTGAKNLKYLDFDGCASLSLVHKSIGALLKLRFYSLRNCKSLVSVPNNINAMISLQHLDLRGCLKFENLPLGQGQDFNSLRLACLIILDLSFCNLLEVPDAIRELECLERLNLQGNRFVSIPSISSLTCLAYLNLSHCYNLETLHGLLPTSDSSGGRYFKMMSGSRDDRSGIYVFDCPKLASSNFQIIKDCIEIEPGWLARLIKNPCHFRGGFDIVVPGWFSTRSWRQTFGGSSIIRITNFGMKKDWLGFAFYVVFRLNNASKFSRHLLCPNSSPVPHSVYLSFESEHTEEYFNIPIDFESGKIVRSSHHWVIYISQEHCHFVKTGAHITFKAQTDFEIIRWGLSSVFKGKAIGSPLVGFDDVTIDMIKPGPKIRLPYNWLVTKKDEVEIIEAKTKEINLSNVGL